MSIFPLNGSCRLCKQVITCFKVLHVLIIFTCYRIGCLPMLPISHQLPSACCGLGSPRCGGSSRFSARAPIFCNAWAFFVGKFGSNAIYWMLEHLGTTKQVYYTWSCRLNWTLNLAPTDHWLIWYIRCALEMVGVGSHGTRIPGLWPIISQILKQIN